MSKDLVTLAATTQTPWPAQPRPIQPAITTEILIALAVIAAAGMLIGAGFLLGRRYRPRSAGGAVQARRTVKPAHNRRVPPPDRNLRLVTRRRR